MKRILFLFAISFFAFNLTSFAAINITNNVGIIKITALNGGTPITIKTGETIPVIADGSTIDLQTGTVTVATTAPSTADLTVVGNMIILSPDNTVQVTLNTNGAVKVYDSTGTATVKTTDGKTSSLKPGQTIIIAGNTIKNLEAYQPPDVNLGPLNTQIQIDNSRKDISPS